MYHADRKTERQKDRFELTERLAQSSLSLERSTSSATQIDAIMRKKKLFEI